MAQVNLAGVDVAEAEKIESELNNRRWQKEFYEQQLDTLRHIRDNMEYYDELSKEPLDEDGRPDFELEKIMGAWWYCNHIVGWDNNIPSVDDFNYLYDDIPNNECMADSIRDCRLEVRRGDVKWDKDFAIRRLNRAIEEYDKALLLMDDDRKILEEEHISTHIDEGAKMLDGNDDEVYTDAVVKPIKIFGKTRDKSQAGLGGWC